MPKSKLISKANISIHSTWSQHLYTLKKYFIALGDRMKILAVTIMISCRMQINKSHLLHEGRIPLNFILS